jgi:aspartyl-tRNA(Asn)/glutamyl-tRNA(Gln) amidotransferase subunit C
MPLSRSDVEKISLLARLQFSEDELDQMTAQLSQIVQYVEQLSDLDTDNVEPMAHTLDLVDVVRPDETRPSLPREEVLANAPRHDDEYYRVPAVLGD